MKASTVPDSEPSMLRQFDTWWFGYGSPTSMGIVRILIGICTLLALVMLTADLHAWFGEDGFMPAWLAQGWLGPKQALGGLLIPRLSLIGGVTDMRVIDAFFGVAIVSATLTALGLWTRVSAFVLAICIVSLHHRDTAILHGGDSAMRIAVIYLAVSPCGRACSLDRLFRLRRGEEDGPVEVSLWGQRLVQYNLALIYVTTVWSKWFGPKWMSGIATWYPARLPEFYRFPVPGLFNDLPFVYFTTYGTLLTEFAMGTVVFVRPLRKYVLFAGVMLHGFIEYSMNIPMFSFLMTSQYVAHFDGEEVAAYIRRLGERFQPLMGLEVFLPPGRRLSPSGERFLHAVDPFGFVRYLPNAHSRDRDLGWDAKKDNGKRSNPFRGVGYRAPGAWPFMVVPGLWRRMMLTSTEAVA